MLTKQRELVALPLKKKTCKLFKKLQNFGMIHFLPITSEKGVGVRGKQQTSRIPIGNDFVRWNVTSTASIYKSAFQMKKCKIRVSKLDIKDFASLCSFCYMRQAHYLP